MGRLIDDCSMLRMLVQHSAPLTRGVYADVQVRKAGDILERYDEGIKGGEPGVKRTPEVDEAYILRSTMSKTCAGCATRALSFCRQNDNGFNSLYATAVYAACSQRERKLGTHLAAAENEKSFPDAVRAGRENTAEKCVEAAHRRMLRFGIYDSGDYYAYAGIVRHFFEELAKKYPTINPLPDRVKSMLGIGNHKLLEHIGADTHILPDNMLCDEDLCLIYRAMTEDTPVEAFEPALTKIEAWLPAVRAFREQLKRKRH